MVTVKSPEKVPTLPVNKKKKKVAEPVEKDRGKEFDSWCVSALDGLGAQVDIPTFLAFLKDIESPYEVSWCMFFNHYSWRKFGVENF